MEVSGQPHSQAAIYPGKQPSVRTAYEAEAGWVSNLACTLWRTDSKAELSSS